MQRSHIVLLQLFFQNRNTKLKKSYIHLPFEGAQNEIEKAIQQLFLSLLLQKNMFFLC